MEFSDSATGSADNKLESSSDFISRAANENSVIRFEKGEDVKTCSVAIVNDMLYETEERFYLVLHEPRGGRIGKNGQTMIVIVPDESDGNCCSTGVLLFGWGGLMGFTNNSKNKWTATMH